MDASAGRPALDRSLAGRAALVGLGALALFGGLVAGNVQAAPPPAAVVREAPAVRLRRDDVTVRQVRTYVEDMIENNRIAAETLNTYQKAFLNNWNTLVHIERRILQNRAALNDPTLRRIYEKTEAALDSVQIFTDVDESRIYSSGGSITIETWDGVRMTIPREPFRRTFRVRRDYSAAARMTTATVRSIDQLLHPGAPPR